MFIVRRFEEISNNAWPALQTIQYDGWLLRFANGVTKRSNSVNMLYLSHLEPAEKIRVCEKLYQSRNITPCFKITSECQPDGIDALLEASGYYLHSHISFQTLDLSGWSPHTDPEIVLETRIRESWIDDFIRMNGFNPANKTTYLSIMQQVLTPFVLLSVRCEGNIAGVGLGVMEESNIGIFDIVVDPRYRRKGLGRGIVEAILSWGVEQGARTAYLQVLTNNTPAINLYQKMGFRELYPYWYRMKK